MNDFSEFTEAVLRKSGWFPERSVRNAVLRWDLELQQDNFQIFPEAEKILTQFGGIKIEKHKSRTKSSRFLPMLLDPTMALGENDRFTEFADLLGNKLYPLGEFIEVHYYLAVSEDGRIFSLMSDLLLIGKNFNQALENIINGIEIDVSNPDYLNLYVD
jgi:hypothetical protein